MFSLLMEIKELGHLVLYVKDIKKSAEFYREILNFKQVFPDQDTDSNFAVFSSGRTHHELLLIEVGPNAKEPPRGLRTGLYHFGLKIGNSDQELKDALKILLDNNVEIVGMSDHYVTHSIYLKDPDGNEIELYVDVNDGWKKDPSLIMSPIKPLYL